VSLARQKVANFRFASNADLTAPKSNFRFTRDSDQIADIAGCLKSADFVAKVGCCRRVVGHFAKSERL
jgi:hypothetical protein